MSKDNTIYDAKTGAKMLLEQIHKRIKYLIANRVSFTTGDIVTDEMLYTLGHTSGYTDLPHERIYSEVANRSRSPINTYAKRLRYAYDTARGIRHFEGQMQVIYTPNASITRDKPAHCTFIPLTVPSRLAHDYIARRAEELAKAEAQAQERVKETEDTEQTPPPMETLAAAHIVVEQDLPAAAADEQPAPPHDKELLASTVNLLRAAADLLDHYTR